MIASCCIAAAIRGNKNLDQDETMADRLLNELHKTINSELVSRSCENYITNYACWSLSIRSEVSEIFKDRLARDQQGEEEIYWVRKIVNRDVCTKSFYYKEVTKYNKTIKVIIWIGNTVLDPFSHYYESKWWSE